MAAAPVAFNAQTLGGLDARYARISPTTPQIDTPVYELHGLSEAEVAVVEG